MMPDWLDRLIGRQSRLAKQLVSYPAYHAPFIGPPQHWSLEQAQANLAHRLEHRELRLQTLAALLADHDVDIKSPLAGGKLKPMLNALNAWVEEHWPALHDDEIATSEVWLRSPRDGKEIIYSLVFDIGLLLGELVVRRRSDYTWTISFDASDKNNLLSFNRAVIQLPATGEMSAPVTHDFESMVAWRYWNPQSAKGLNSWAQAVSDAILGLSESAWLTPAPISESAAQAQVRAIRRAQLESERSASKSGSPNNRPIPGGTVGLLSPLDQTARLLTQISGAKVRGFSTRDFGRERYLGGRSVLVPGDKAATLLGELRPNLPKGIIAFIGIMDSGAEPKPNGVELVIAEGDSQFDILLVAATDAVNYGWTTADLVREFQSWDAEFGIDIWQAATDVVKMRLKALPNDLQRFAAHICEFCPDIVDRGDDHPVATIVSNLKERQELVLRWD
jgi:hypothetical protein